MNKCKGFSKVWYLVLLLVVFVAGCGSDNNGPAAPVPANKAISAFSLNGATGIITGSAIAVTVPNGTPVTGLVATFTTTGASVKVGTPAVTQVSGTTVNNFTSPVAYTVTATDGTTATYTVTVTVAPGTAKAITTYSLGGFTGTITGSAIAVSVPNGTPVTGLVATFTTTGASVMVGAVTQTSGTTPNNFTSAVLYTVTAADSTTATYTVTVTVAAVAGPPPVALLSAGNYVILAETGVSTVPTSVITGNVGLSADAPALTGFDPLTVDNTSVFSTSPQVTGQLFAADYADPTPGALITATDDMLTAYTDASGRTATSAATTNVGAGTLTNLTLVPATYVWGSNVTIPTNLTLSGGPNDVWIFVVTGTLDMAASQNIILTGGAQAKNIFWAVSGDVTIAPGAHFEGIILGQTLIALQSGASINGRLLAQSAVTLIANTVTQK